MTIACDGDGAGLVGLWLEGQKYFGGSVSGEMREKHQVPLLDAAREWLDRHFTGERPAAAELPLTPNGSEFRRDI